MIEDEINQDFITKEARKCVFSLEFITHTIDEVTNCSKYDFSFVRNKELNG